MPSAFALRMPVSTTNAVHDLGHIEIYNRASCTYVSGFGYGCTFNRRRLRHGYFKKGHADIADTSA